MTPNDENLNRLEEFLSAIPPQTKDEALNELTAHGVDVAAFKARVASVVRKGYQHQVKLAAQAARADASTKTNRRFGDLMGKGLAELVAIFERIRSGEYGVGYQQAALARCRNLQDVPTSETDLRSWLEDISTMDEQ
ncbi:MAG: hypothetical protein RL088_621 [Verrucomicrobiota bacterium]|jgi:hypothetical protein